MADIQPTVWQTPSGEGEFSTGTAQSLADPLGVALADPVGVSVVDTGQAFTDVPVTTWTASDGS